MKRIIIILLLTVNANYIYSQNEKKQIETIISNSKDSLVYALHFSLKNVKGNYSKKQVFVKGQTYRIAVFDPKNISSDIDIMIFDKKRSIETIKYIEYNFVYIDFYCEHGGFYNLKVNNVNKDQLLIIFYIKKQQ